MDEKTRLECELIRVKSDLRFLQTLFEIQVISFFSAILWSWKHSNLWGAWIVLALIVTSLEGIKEAQVKHALRTCIFASGLVGFVYHLVTTP